MKRKVQDLSGASLDWAVAKAEGALAPLGNLHLVGADLFIGINGDLGEPGEWVVYRPSSDWAQGGPIIERERICLSNWVCEWDACMTSGPRAARRVNGPTPLIAAMRCYVASKLGNELEVPCDIP